MWLCRVSGWSRPSLASRSLSVVSFRVADPRQALARGLANADGGEAPLAVAAMAADVLHDQSLQQSQAGGLQGALRGQDLGHGTVLGLGPGMEGGHELRPVDQPGLEREQAKE
jgi:hypothetical protein